MATRTRDFDRLPTELISLIAGELEAESLGALRLTSKHFRAIFTPPFLRHVRHVQEVDFTLRDIRRLQCLSLSADLKSAVRALRFVSPHYHMTPAKMGGGTTYPGDLYPMRRDALLDPLNFLQEPGDRSWMERRISEQSSLGDDRAAASALLTEVLCNFGALEGLSLEAAVVLGPRVRWAPERVEHLEWREMWRQNLQAFRCVVSSVAESQIRIDRLELFKDTSISSIPINEISITQTHGFEEVASRLKHFSISLSTVVRDPEYSDPSIGPDTDDSRLESDKAAARSQAKGMSDVARLIQAMPNLEFIYIHFYQTCRFDRGPTPCLGMLENVFQSAKESFRHLTSMSLHCVPITPSTVETILQRCPILQSLRLGLLQLDEDGWVKALTPLISSSVKYAYLSNLQSSDYGPGFRVLRNDTIRDGLALGERHPQVEVVRRSDDHPPGAGAKTSTSRDPNKGILIELESIPNPNSQVASFQQVQWARVLQRLCGPPCRVGQYLFGGGMHLPSRSTTNL